MIPELSRGLGGIGREADAVRSFVLDVKPTGDGDVAEFPALEISHGFLEHFGAAALDADLDDALGFGGDLDHAATFGNGEGEGLFDVDVLAGATGVDHHEGVPMVRGGDGDGINVFVFEELAVVFIAGGGGAGFFGGEIEITVIQVADGDGLGVAEFEEAVVDLVAAIAETDEAHAETIIGTEDARVAESGEGKDVATVHVMRLQF